MDNPKKSPLIGLLIFIALFSLWDCEQKKSSESINPNLEENPSSFFILINQKLQSILIEIESERRHNERFESRKDIFEVTDSIFESGKAIFEATDSIFVFDSDTLFIELKPSKRRKLNNYITAQESELRKILSGIDSMYLFDKVKLKKIEDYYLNRDQSIAHRNDTSLFLKLKNGAFQVLKNIYWGDGPRKFFYQGFLKEIGYYCIFTFNLEGASYRLYNQSTGKELVINGILNPSPNGQYRVSTPYNLGVFYNSPNLNLWIMGKEKLVLLFEWENGASENSGFGEVPWRTEWIDNQTLLIETGGFINFKREGEGRLFELKIIQKKK